MIPNIHIDLSSDTSTRPSPEMRTFMSQAEVGDELGELIDGASRLHQGVVPFLVEAMRPGGNRGGRHQERCQQRQEGEATKAPVRGRCRPRVNASTPKRVRVGLPPAFVQQAACPRGQRPDLVRNDLQRRDHARRRCCLLGQQHPECRLHQPGSQAARF